MTLVGKKAPEFSATAIVNGEVVENFSLNQYIGEKYVVFFFYPFDFTFVCPTEILDFQKKLAQFHEKNTVVVGCSIDSPHTHRAWLNTPVKDGGIQGVQYPLVADVAKTIATNYGVLAGQYDYTDEGMMEFHGVGAAYRGTFLIDKEGTVRHSVVNDLPLGRNIDEALRMVDALQHHEEHGEVCPVGWNKGDDTMVETPESVANYLATH